MATDVDLFKIGLTSEVDLFGNGALRGPSNSQSSMNGSIADSVYPCPLANSRGNTINGDFPDTPLIVGLLKLVSPFAIFGAVVAIVIYALNAATLWPVAHVGVEVFKRIPALTDFNASPAIVLIPFVVWIVASLTHSAPNFPYFGLAHPVSAISFAGKLRTQAPARFRFPACKFWASNRFDVAAITKAVKMRNTFAVSMVKPNNHEAPISLPGVISRCWHDKISDVERRQV